MGRDGASPGLALLLAEGLDSRRSELVLHAVDPEGVSRPVTGAALLAEAVAAARLVVDTTGPDDIVAIACRAPARQAAFWLAAIATGRLPSFIAPPSPHMDRDKQVRDRSGMMAAAGIRWLADEQGLHDAGTGRLLAWPVPLAGDSDLLAMCTARNADSPVLVQHSSGTTGQPKGIALTSGQIVAHAQAYGAATGMGPDDRIVSWLPLYHDMGFVACFLMPLLLGIPYVQIDPFQWVRDPLLLWDKVAEHDGRCVWLPNFAFALFTRLAPQAAARGLSLSGLRMLVNCSEVVSPRTVDEFARAFAPLGLRPDAVRASYAMAENVFAVTQTPGGPPNTVAADRWIAEGEGRIVAAADPARRIRYASSGMVLPTTRLRILDGHGRELPEGRVGRIQVTGEHCIAGYLTAAPERQAAFSGGWYDTGDRGFLLGGELYVIGREAEFAIVNGRNVPLQEIEAAADEVPGVRRGRSIALALYDDNVGSERPVVIAEPQAAALAASPESPEAQALALALRRQIRNSLDVTPGDVRLVPAGWVVKSTSGKRARSATLEKYVAAFRPDLQPPEG